MMPPQSLVTKPLVTIAIPCFNAESTIERAIESAQNQDWPNTEILIVDDASEDETISIIEMVAKDDKKIRLICHESNQGAAVARNALVENARGEFIAFFDADDVSYLKRISLQYQRLTNYEQEKGVDLVLCYAGVRVMPADETEPYELEGVGHRAPEPVGQNYVWHFIPVKSNMKKSVWGHSASSVLFMRRVAFNHVGPFDPLLRRAQDTDYAIRAGLKGAHFISVDQPLIDWYITEADYKTDQKLLHYHHLMYQKYRYLFPNGFQHWCAWQFSKVALCQYMAMRKQRKFLMKWYFGWAFFWLFMILPGTRLKGAFRRAKNIFRIRRIHRAEMASQKAGK